MLLPNIDGGVVSKARGDINVAPPLYDPEGSIFLDGRDGEGGMLQFRPETPSDSTKWCYSIWIKNGGFSYSDRHFTLLGAVNQNGIPSALNTSRLDDNMAYIAIDDSSTFKLSNITNNATIDTYTLPIKFKDSADWQHLFVRFDTTRDILELFVNGVFAGDVVVAKDILRFGDTSHYHYIGADSYSRTRDAYFTDPALIFGEGQLDVNDFGYTDEHGVWRPKDLTQSLPKSIWKGSSFYLQPGKTPRFTEEAEGGIAHGHKYQRGFQRFRVGFEPDMVMVFSTKYGFAEGADFTFKELPELSINASNEVGAVADPNGVKYFHDGFSMGTSGNFHNENGFPYSYLAFKKGAKYGIDIIHYTGDGQDNRRVAHELEQRPLSTWIIPVDVNANRTYNHIELGPNRVMTLEDGELTASTGYIRNLTDKEVVVSNSANVNASGVRYAMICFGNKQGVMSVEHLVGPGNSLHSGSTETPIDFHGLVAFTRRMAGSGNRALDIITNDSVRSISSAYAVAYPNNSANNPQFFSSNQLNWLTTVAETIGYAARADTRSIFKACKSVVNDVQLIPRRMSTHDALSDDSPFRNLGVWKNAETNSTSSFHSGGLGAHLGNGATAQAKWSKSIRGRCYWEVNVESSGSGYYYLVGLTGNPGYTSAAYIDWSYYVVYYANNGTILSSPPGTGGEQLGTTTGGGHRHIYSMLWDPEIRTLKMYRDGSLLFEQDMSAYDLPDSIYPYIRHASGAQSTVFAMNDGRFPFLYPELADNAPSLMEDGLKPIADIKNSQVAFKPVAYKAGDNSGHLFSYTGQPASTTCNMFEADGKLYLYKANFGDGSTHHVNDELIRINEDGSFEVVLEGQYGSATYDTRHFESNGRHFLIVCDYNKGAWGSANTGIGIITYEFHPKTETLTTISVLPNGGVNRLSLYEFNGELFLARCVWGTSYENIRIYKWQPDHLTWKEGGYEALTNATAAQFWERDGTLYLSCAALMTAGRKSATYRVDPETGNLALVFAGPNVNQARSLAVNTAKDGNTYMLMSYTGTSNKLFKWDPVNEDWIEDVAPGSWANCYGMSTFKEGEEVYFAMANAEYTSSNVLHHFDPVTKGLTPIVTAASQNAHDAQSIKYRGVWYTAFANHRTSSSYAQGYITVVTSKVDPDTGILKAGRFIEMPKGADLMWVKDRTTPGIAHRLYSPKMVDKELYPGLNLPAGNSATVDWHDDGVLLQGGYTGHNTGNINHVAYFWKTGPEYGIDFSLQTSGPDGTTAVTHEHNCGDIPEVLMIKGLTNNSSWHVRFEDFADTDTLLLDTNTVRYTLPGAKYWDKANFNEKSVSLFAANAIGVNQGFAMLAIRSVPGYSKTGFYWGNGNASGIDFNLGFKPAWMLVKIENVVGNDWVIFDSSRSPFNKDGMARLRVNGTQVEDAAENNDIFFTSTGFKCDGTGSSMNRLNAKYTFIAFAENPFEHTNAR
ncbi:hypothetical protein [Vibrio phage vB_VmeM-Yong XC32]|nr:hypothetical protein [Vibrio phage vB_VmeM-Yong XC31]QAX96481.1 hypothetical protein [Vibrio phage vB_VmeM-Yong XC32]QAX96798.1 hypothetical protein [Vibrio phage vB_VmeM-Yong MS31]QAX97117.1 hypothetical protein [Vibrio phage vB_VmeM-Yong MS32]